MSIFSLGKSFNIFWAVRTLSLLTNSMTPIALTFAILRYFHTSSFLGYVLASQMVPMLVFTIIGGGISDRYSRKRVLQLSNFVTGLTLIAIALSLSHRLSIIFLLLLCLTNGASEALSTPALRGIVPQLVEKEHLVKANSILTSTKNLSKICGPPVAGILSFYGNGLSALFIDGTMSLIAAVMMLALPLSGRIHSPSSHFIQDLHDGWKYFIGNKWIWSITCTLAVLNFIQIGIWQILGPIIALTTIGGFGWGMIQSTRAIGSLLMGSFLIKRNQQRSLIQAFIALTVTGIPLIFLGIYPHIYLLAASTFLAGLGISYFSITWDSTLQIKVPENMLSRVSSYDDLGSFIGIPAAQIFTFMIASHLGIGFTITIGAILYIGFSLCSLLMLAKKENRNA